MTPLGLSLSLAPLTPVDVVSGTALELPVLRSPERHPVMGPSVSRRSETGRVPPGGLWRRLEGTWEGGRMTACGSVGGSGSVGGVCKIGYIR